MVIGCVLVHVLLGLYFPQALKTTAALLPPNPKEFERTVLMGL
jgi:hypothetical protein